MKEQGKQFTHLDSNDRYPYEIEDGMLIELKSLPSAGTNQEPDFQDSAYVSGQNSSLGTYAYPSPNLGPLQPLPMAPYYQPPAQYDHENIMRPQQNLQLASYHQGPAQYDHSNYMRSQQALSPAQYSMGPFQYGSGESMHQQQYQQNVPFFQDHAQYEPNGFLQAANDQSSHAFDDEDQFGSMPLDLPAFSWSGDAEGDYAEEFFGLPPASEVEETSTGPSQVQRSRKKEAQPLAQPTQAQLDALESTAKKVIQPKKSTRRPALEEEVEMGATNNLVTKGGSYHVDAETGDLRRGRGQHVQWAMRRDIELLELEGAFGAPGNERLYHTREQVAERCQQQTAKVGADYEWFQSAKHIETKAQRAALNKVLEKASAAAKARFGRHKKADTGNRPFNVYGALRGLKDAAWLAGHDARAMAFEYHITMAPAVNFIYAGQPNPNLRTRPVNTRPAKVVKPAAKGVRKSSRKTKQG